MRNFILISLLYSVLACQPNSNSEYFEQGVATSARISNDDNYQLNKLRRELENSTDSVFVQSIDNSLSFIDSIEYELIEHAGGFGEHGLIEHLLIANPSYQKSFDYLTSKYGNEHLKTHINRPFLFLKELDLEVSELARDPVEDPVYAMNPEKLKHHYWIDYFRGLTLLQTLITLEQLKEEIITLERQCFINLRSEI